MQVGVVGYVVAFMAMENGMVAPFTHIRGIFDHVCSFLNQIIPMA